MKGFSFYLLLLVLISCSIDDSIAVDVVDSSKIYSSQMDLENLQIGQKFYYTLLLGEDYRADLGSEYEYPGDTLVLEVIEKANNGYIISEKITDGSFIKSSTDDYYWGDQDTIFENTWRLENNSLFIESANSYWDSHLALDRTLSLKEFTDMEAKINGWTTNHPYTESNVDLYVQGYSLFGKEYDRLNISIQNEAMTHDGPGITTVYSKEHGIVRTSIYSWWTSSGYGWDRIK